MKPARSKIVVVTGASSGIGEAAASALLARGHRVHAGARRVERMRGLADAGAAVHPLDLASPESVEAFHRAVLEREGRIDVLVNNAGAGLHGPVENVPLEEARRLFEVNLFGLARLVQLVLPRFRLQGGGRIVNISCVGGRIYSPLGAWYHASKHALEGWSDCLRVETAPLGVEVVVIRPGAIATPFAENLVEPLLSRSRGGPYEALAERLAGTLRRACSPGRASPPERVADLIVRVVESGRPRPRYAAGRFARSAVAARCLLGDRLFDRLIRRSL